MTFSFPLPTHTAQSVLRNIFLLFFYLVFSENISLSWICVAPYINRFNLFFNWNEGVSLWSSVGGLWHERVPLWRGVSLQLTPLEVQCLQWQLVISVGWVELFQSFAAMSSQTLKHANIPLFKYGRMQIDLARIPAGEKLHWGRAAWFFCWQLWGNQALVNESYKYE